MKALAPYAMLCGTLWQAAAARLDNCSIFSPQRSDRYAPGDEFALAGSCTNADGTPVDAADLAWKIEYRRDGAVAGTVPVTREASGDFFRTSAEDGQGTSWYRVWLTAPDTAVKFAIDILPADGKARDVYLSDLAWSEIANGWGPVEKDGSNGETAEGDGSSLSIRYNGFGKGFGTHAPSEIAVPLEGACYSLITSYGTDDEVDGGGSVAFRIQGDGKTLFQSPVVKGIERIGFAAVDVTGVKELRLEVLDGGDGNEADHAAWGGTRAVCREGFGPTAAKAPRRIRAHGEDWSVSAADGAGFEFRFGMEAPGDVTLELRDLRGRLVARTTRGGLAAGRHRLELPSGPADKGPGVYLATLRTDSGARTRAVVGFKD